MRFTKQRICSKYLYSKIKTNPFRSLLNKFMVRLLQSHCNRERATAHLKQLRAQAAAERVLRPQPAAPVRRGPKRLSEATNAGIVADYQAGMKSSEIAAKYGINEWTVRHRLHRAGVPLRSNSMNDHQVELTRQLRADGLSYTRIAEQVRFSEGTVRNVLKRLKP